MPGAFNPDVTLPGLWTDKPDWLNHLRALAATGHINQADADQLAHFADHGWLLMEGAIEPEFVDTLVNDIRKLHRQPGYFATTDFRHGRSQKLNGNQPDELESIFDLYVNLQSSRHVCMHPRIIRFLSLVFQAKVLAFQQLLFQVTNGHQWHQDTAYVVVDTPTLLAATWIALQDIEEGSGELAYYDAQPPPAALHLQQRQETQRRQHARLFARHRGRLPGAATRPPPLARQKRRRVLLDGGPGTPQPSARRCGRTRRGCPA